MSLVSHVLVLVEKKIDFRQKKNSLSGKLQVFNITLTEFQHRKKIQIYLDKLNYLFKTAYFVFSLLVF